MSEAHEQDDQRRFSRVNFDAEVTIVKGDEKWTSSLQDISLNGALVVSPEEGIFDLGEHYNLELIPTEDGYLITFEGEVAHIHEKGIGFQITNIDVESVAYLRRLMELNLGNPELMDRELSALHWR